MRAAKNALPDLVDGNGNPIRLGSLLGQGGEGAVYEVASSKGDIVVKVYHSPLSKERAEKIQTMVKLRSNALASLTAWPVDLVSTKLAREPVGLLMPKIANRKDIHHLYSPKSRRAEFQRADWRFLVRTAANTAKAFAAVHATSCVIGDVNHGGVLVAQDATVRLIDCDSFQVTSGGRRFFCEVGVETFTPPELQGKSFSGVVRTENHDNFGLAVMTFLLLFMGRHPFAGRFSGQGDMPIQKAIEEVRFPYGARHAQVQMSPPPGTPPLSIVGPKLEAMFERAFSREAITGGRPSAKEWATALGGLEKELKQCGANPAHWHHRSVSCPWCRMEGATGVPLFALVVQTSGGTIFDIDVLWRQIEAIPSPGPAPELAESPAIPSDAAKALSGSSWKSAAVASVVAVALMLVWMMGGSFLFVLGGVGAFFAIRAVMRKSKEIEEFRRARDTAQATWKQIESVWQERAGSDAFDAKKRQLEGLRREWNDIPNVRQRKLAELQRNQRALQLNRFLDAFEIDKAKIAGIGSGRKQTLESFGIETAADVTRAALQRVPGFGPRNQQRMLDWRQAIESKFVFDPNKAIDPRDTAKVEQEILSERKRVHDLLNHGLAELRQLKAQADATRQHMKTQAEAAKAAYLQAEANHVAASK